MSEIKFKAGVQLPADTSKINDSDIVMVNNNMDGKNESESGLGSVYKGTKIVGTTKADELRLTRPLTATGVTIGGISDNTTFAAGTSLDEILEKLLIKEIDNVTYTAPSVTLTKTCDDTVEFGTTVSLGLDYTFTDGKYNSTTSAKCSDKNTPEYYLGTTKQTDKPETVPTAENTYSYYVKVPYNAGLSAAELGLKTNLNNPSKKTAPAGTATSNTLKVTVAKKWYVEYGTQIISNWTTNSTIEDINCNSDVVFWIPSDYSAVAKLLGTDMIPFMTKSENQSYGDASYKYTKYTYGNPNKDTLQLTDIQIKK